MRYIKERNAVNVAESSNTGDSITLQVTDTLDNTIYNYPLTIRRPLPAGWLAVKVSQNGLPVNASIMKVNSVKYVMFDVVPNGGDVVLSKTLYGDFTDGNTVAMDDLAFFSTTGWPAIVTKPPPWTSTEIVWSISTNLLFSPETGSKPSNQRL